MRMFKPSHPPDRRKRRFRDGSCRLVELLRCLGEPLLESAELWFVDSRCRGDYIPAHADSQEAFHRLYFAALQAFFLALGFAFCPAFLQKFLGV